MNKSSFKNLVVVLCGHALEIYDAILYGFLMVILAPLFFPSSDPSNSMILGFASYALGFFVRPLGGVLFGHIGDHFGRKTNLVLSLSLTSVATFVVGTLPTYNEIGIFAPLSFIFCRICQGLAVGGEYSGASVFSIEHAPPHKRFYRGSFVAVAGFAGAIFASLMGALVTSKTLLPFLPFAGWRVPFLLGGILGFLCYYARKALLETPAYEALGKDTEPKVSFKGFWMELSQSPVTLVGLIRGFLISGIYLGPFFIGTIYLSGQLTPLINLSISESLAFNCGILVFWMLLVPWFGKLSDSLTAPFIFRFGCWGILLSSLPLFYWMTSRPTIATYLIGQAFLGLWGASMIAPVNGMTALLFPPSIRLRATALSYTMGQALLGGTAPLIASKLVVWCETPSAPAFYLMFCGVAGLLALVKYPTENPAH